MHHSKMSSFMCVTVKNNGISCLYVSECVCEREREKKKEREREGGGGRERK